ncbi:MAG: metalloregulator ArsR/SmtB family transcription factor [Gemmatimonadota bacterium]|jgi:DNA-binding transcriptional ArsR family regulator
MITYDREAVFDALADGTRRRILDLLSVGERPAGEIADSFDISRPAVSRHLRKLRRAGLVERRKEAQWRVYRLNPEALKEVDRWMEKYRVFWAARMHDLKRYVEESP